MPNQQKHGGTALELARRVECSSATKISCSDMLTHICLAYKTRINLLWCYTMLAYLNSTVQRYGPNQTNLFESWSNISTYQAVLFAER